MKNTILVILATLFLVACSSTKGTPKRKGKEQSLEKIIVGVWEMIAIRFHDGRVMVGEYMGYPHYAFSAEGKRIKTLETQPAPPAEIVNYQIKGDSLFYPDTKYPPMRIIRVANDTLTLTNSKLSWHLVRKASKN